MVDRRLYEKAAACYDQAHLAIDAIRCYRLAGFHRRAAELNLARGDHREAARDYERAGMRELAAWLLAHDVGDLEAALAVVGRWRGEPGGLDPAVRLRRGIVECRCEVADGSPASVILPVMDDVCASLADPVVPYDRLAEEWAVSLASHARRLDQVALVFAAAVRGQRVAAAQRWKTWSDRVLGMELTIPGGPAPEREPGRTGS